MSLVQGDSVDVVFLWSPEEDTYVCMSAVRFTENEAGRSSEVYRLLIPVA